MGADLKAKWVEALRSGKYKQGKGRLRDTDDNFCCLGVLWDVYSGEWVQDANGKWCTPEREYGYFETADVPGGLSSDTQEKLYSMNDGKNDFQGDPKDFAQIADWIEENLQ